MVEGEWDLDIALERADKPEEAGALIACLLSPVAGSLTRTLTNIGGGANL